jgi:predicted ATPase
MITNLRAQNFKSWKDTGDLPLAPLTGLFGTNSSGKSSILQLLLLMKQTSEHRDPKRALKLGEDFPGDERLYVDLRSFRDLIHGHQEFAHLGLGISWTDTSEMPGMWLKRGTQIQFQATISDEDNLIAAREVAYVVDGKKLSVPDIESPLHFYGAQLGTPHQHGELLHVFDLQYSLEECLRTVFYLGPLRTEPQASYLWSGSPPLDVGRRGEFAIQALLAMRGKNDRVQQQVAVWLRQLDLISAMDLLPVAEKREDYEVRVKQTPVSAEVLLPDVGFGVSQILPVLVLCAYAEEGSILLLEQPEMHLHPSAQSELADVLLDAVRRRRLQIIVESHSEHFLRRLQLRIAQEQLSTEDAALYFCHMENGESKADLLRLTEDGYIKNWPPNFFGDEMADIVGMTEASIGRRRRGK